MCYILLLLIGDIPPPPQRITTKTMISKHHPIFEVPVVGKKRLP